MLAQRHNRTARCLYIHRNGLGSFDGHSLVVLVDVGGPAGAIDILLFALRGWNGPAEYILYVAFIASCNIFVYIYVYTRFLLSPTFVCCLHPWLQATVFLYNCAGLVDQGNGFGY